MPADGVHDFHRCAAPCLVEPCSSGMDIGAIRQRTWLNHTDLAVHQVTLICHGSGGAAHNSVALIAVP